MRILHICNMTMNGKACILVNIIENTDFSKNDITILKVYGMIDASLKQILDKYSIRIINSKTSLMNSIRCLSDILSKEHFDVVHLHMHDLSGICFEIARNIMCQ